MHIKTLWAMALVMQVAGVSAQQMYKCGSTYSQTPCGPDAAAKALPSAVAPERAPGSSGYEACAATAIKSYGGPEPDSARIQPLGNRKSEVIQYAGKPLAAYRYDLTIDAKTPYGVYSGRIAYSCWLSEDQRRVLQFAPVRDY